MPNMIERRYDHCLVRLKSKIFAIGGASLNTKCEVFDKISYMFTTVETPKFNSYRVESVLVGSRIFVFQNDTKVVLCYDDDKCEWTEKSCKATENIGHYSSVKIPFY